MLPYIVSAFENSNIQIHKHPEPEQLSVGPYT